MDQPGFLNQIIESAAFPFRDPQWPKKVAIGVGLTFAMFVVPIVPMLFVYGYSKRLMRQIITGSGKPSLPEWTDWGKLLSDGLQLWGAAVIYVLPLLLLMIGAMIVLFMTTITPVFFVHSDGTNSPQMGLLYVAGLMIFSLMMAIIALLGWGISLLQAPALSHLAARDEFSAAFRIGEWWPILKKGIGPFLIAIIASMVLIWVLTFAIQFMMFTIILIFLLPLVIGIVGFFINIIQNAFYAMAYREALSK
jgi:hypothetical protein